MNLTLKDNMTKIAEFCKKNLAAVIMIPVTAALITAAGIIFRQSPLRILPLYVSLFVLMLQAKANRAASLIGSFNCILYTFVYIRLGLYAFAATCALVSGPLQMVTFILWSRRKYGQSTYFRKMSVRWRIITAAIFIVSFFAVFFILDMLGSSHQFIDDLASMLGTLNTVLLMLAFIEYTWLMIPAGIITIVMHITTVPEVPGQVTYVIFSVYSLICVIMQFFRVRQLYAKQQEELSAADQVRKEESPQTVAAGR